MLQGASQIRERVAAELVGREAELELVLATVATGRDIVLEGPPGTSKTTMLAAITSAWQIPLVLVEGNGDLTPAKLVGHHDPARVLREGYTAENFVAGPLVQAMREGGFLYIEELNRAPEETLNALLMAIGERALEIPRVGTIAARDSFRVIASMNPFDNIGTTRLSASIHDRLCRLAVGYQDAQAEAEIVCRRAPVDRGRPLDRRLVEHAVALTRATREHELIRQGASVRGAIDTAALALGLAAMRDVREPEDESYGLLLLDAALVALGGRIILDPVCEQTPEAILRELWEQLLIPSPATAPG